MKESNRDKVEELKFESYLRSRGKCDCGSLEMVPGFPLIPTNELIRR